MIANRWKFAHCKLFLATEKIFRYRSRIAGGMESRVLYTGELRCLKKLQLWLLGPSFWRDVIHLAKAWVQAQVLVLVLQLQLAAIRLLAQSLVALLVRFATKQIPAKTGLKSNCEGTLFLQRPFFVVKGNLC